ncbi:F-box domain-containing protein [Heracleum sosnowskyi]|uniref:F-box domain-containing protein n=1 Tax=Heracleum sosnowskyi TaxID=360622 RepID=A0AAD8HSA6_9APIA|nr:F-box domain-containing protein [Heracleum sosnowskyi]
MITTHDNNNNPKYLFFNNINTHELIIRSDDAQCQEYCTLDYPLDLPNHAWCAISHGLMCLSGMFNDGFRYNPKIYLWNPLVEKYKVVPKSPLLKYTEEETKWKALAFGFLPEVNDYVVIHLVKPYLSCEPEDDPHTVMIGFYSLNSNSWKTSSEDGFLSESLSSNDAVFVDGAAFWIGDYSDEHEYQQVIICFDTNTDIMFEILLPDIAPQLQNPVIHPFGGLIAYFVEDDEDHHLDVWVLKNDAVNEFHWVNKMSIDLSEDVWVEVLGIRNNGEPILAKSNSLISCNYDNHEPYDFVDSCDRLSPSSNYEEHHKPPFVIWPFVETLVLLDIGRKPNTILSRKPWHRNRNLLESFNYSS